jgi:hypothetical protein
MIKNKCIHLVFVLFLGLISCENNKVVTYSFYHWKTDFNLSKEDKLIIKNGGANKLYLRFFDIYYNAKQNKALPIATTQFKIKIDDVAKDIIPVVFITNEVFNTLDESACNDLAKQVSYKIKRLLKTHLKNGNSCSEIQIDCDWSRSTKHKYFSFLQQLKTYFKAYKLSATLRLHQVKYREETGIPPVDSAVLMAYNVGNIENIEEENSIISASITAKYLERLSDYPLPYDVALPVFEWAVLYRRGKVVAILNQYNLEDLKVNFKKTNTENIYKAKHDCYINGTFIYQSDLLRTETVSKNDLKVLSDIIRKASQHPYETIFYHISSPLIKQFSNNELKTYCYY